MTTHTIDALLPGPIDPALQLQLAMTLPITLRQVERTDERAPDYHIDTPGGADLGYGWSQISPRHRIPYVGLLIKLPTGVQISGVAWQSPEAKGRWFVQFQHVSEARLHA